ncbi:hypothetical protein QR685DRAFT_576548 [Neurospora intermedia]|uniref:Uncharacterized protein n=1 Tax=Neurospora intermedia TaxID=5142 RepID=A0ABR3CX42_NEUIN
METQDLPKCRFARKSHMATSWYDFISVTEMSPTQVGSAQATSRMVLRFDPGSVSGVVHQWLSEADRSGLNPSRIPSRLVWSPPSTPDRLPETFGHLAQKLDILELEGE